MEPNIDYATTSDGVHIATLALGVGQPLLIAATPPWSHVLLELRIPPMQSWVHALAEQARVVRYDCRGTGLSDRNALDLSIETQLRDLEAVADHYGLERFAIWGAIGGSPAAIAYTARHPKRVSHLLLWHAYVRGASMFGRPESSALGALLREDWELYTDAYAQAAFGWSESETAAQYARLMRAAITQDDMVTAAQQMAALDVRDEARTIRTPTLVMVRDSKYSGIDEARTLAALIPGARLLVLDGSLPAPFLGDTASVIAAMREFMATTGPVRRPSKAARVPLTDREQQVLRLLANGGSGKEIAAALGISVSTTQRHIANIYAKIGARGRVEAANYAMQQGFGPRHDAEPT